MDIPTFPIFMMVLSLLVGIPLSILLIKKRRNVWLGILGGLVLVISVCILALYSCLIIMEYKREKLAKFANSYDNIVFIQAALDKYVKNNNQLPDASEWCDALLEVDNNLTKATFQHPFFSKGVCDFAFNEDVSGKKFEELKPKTVLVFEASGGWNLYGGRELIRTRKKTGASRIYLLLANGNIASMPVAAAQEYFDCLPWVD